MTILGSLLLLSSCANPQLSALSENDTILAFGDSLTAGYGVDAQQSYPSILSELIQRKVINAGISGETTAQGLERFANKLEQHQPKLVILMEGGNDFLRNKPTEDTLNNLRQMVQQAQARNIQVLLIGVPPKKLFAGSHELYETLADELKIPLEDDIIPSLILRPSMKSDYVHFNAKGYAALAEAIAEKLRELGAI